MASLVARCIDRLTDAEIAAGETRIPIHAFCAYINEERRGKRANMRTVWNIEPFQNQKNQLARILDLYNAAPNKDEFVRVLKDALLIGEVQQQGKIPLETKEYWRWSTVEADLEEVVTDQGGTLPP